MALNRKLAAILAFIMISTVALAGCSQVEEIMPDAGSVITEPSGLDGEEANSQEGETEEEASTAGENEKLATFSGILKAADVKAGTITIANDSIGELMLKIDDKSKIIEGETQITFDDLANKIGSEFIAQYDDATKLVTIIYTQDSTKQ